MGARTGELHISSGRMTTLPQAPTPRQVNAQALLRKFHPPQEVLEAGVGARVILPTRFLSDPRAGTLAIRIKGSSSRGDLENDFPASVTLFTIVVSGFRFGQRVNPIDYWTQPAPAYELPQVGQVVAARLR